MNFFKTILETKYKVDESFKSSFDIWQKNLFKTSIYISFITILVEFLFLFFYVITDNLNISIWEYILTFILKPCIINSLFIILGGIAIRHKKISDENKIAIPILLFIVIFSNLIITHYVFPVLYSILIVPIFLSTIYASYAIELKTFLFSLLGMVTSILFIELDTISLKPEKYYYNVFLSFLILCISHLISISIIKNESTKEKILKENCKVNNILLENLYKDGFTKLFNHTALFNLLNYYVSSNNCNNENLHIAVIDVDCFKKINDTYGHEAGNVVLIEISTRLINIMEKNSNIFVARYGGDEICMVFNDISKEYVYDLLENFRIDISNKKFKELNNNNVTVSIGIASYNKENSSDFFNKADIALYEAKNNGRNQINIFKE